MRTVRRSGDPSLPLRAEPCQEKLHALSTGIGQAKAWTSKHGVQVFVASAMSAYGGPMGDSTHVDPLVQFWDRPPEVIHAELCNPRRLLGSQPVRDRASTALPPELEDLLRALVSELNEAEYQFICSLPTEDYPDWRVWLSRYREMSPEQRVETVTGWFVSHVARGGPDILAGSAAQAHLARLQQTMDRHSSLQARKAARRQLRRILTASLPNFRNTRDRVNARAVLAFYDRLRSRCLAILDAPLLKG
jgi:hypothetical protein